MLNLYIHLYSCCNFEVEVYEWQAVNSIVEVYKVISIFYDDIIIMIYVSFGVENYVLGSSNQVQSFII